MAFIGLPWPRTAAGIASRSEERTAHRVTEASGGSGGPFRCSRRAQHSAIESRCAWEPRDLENLLLVERLT
jgi:hypothetical protein